MRLLRTKRIAYVAAMSAAAIAIGCGDDDDGGSNNADRYSGEEAEVAGLVDDLADAGSDGDGELICEQIFTPVLTAFIEKQSGHTCATEVEENVPEGEYELEVDTIEIADGAATVGVTDNNDVKLTLRIEQVDGDWRVARVLPSL